MTTTKEQINNALDLIDIIIDSGSGERFNILVPPAFKETAKTYGVKWDDVLNTHYFCSTNPEKNPLWELTYDQFVSVKIPDGLSKEQSQNIEEVYIDRLEAFKSTDLNGEWQLYVPDIWGNRHIISKLRERGLINE